MEPGKLNKRVSIQAATETANSRGGIDRSWSTSATVWAAIEPMSARELFFAQQTQSLATHKVTMRYRSTLTASMRLIFGSRVFNILGVVHTAEAQVETIAFCVEQATGA